MTGIEGDFYMMGGGPGAEFNGECFAAIPLKIVVAEGQPPSLAAQRLQAVLDDISEVLERHEYATLAEGQEAIFALGATLHAIQAAIEERLRQIAGNN